MESYKPIDGSQTINLIKKAKQGDEDATNTLVSGNFPLIKTIVKKYLGKGVEYDDLYQIGCVGFLKAIKNFNPEFDVKFSTYAVPMIAGEIKRFLRDDGNLKVSRSIKTLAIKLKSYIEDLKKEGCDSPSINELAKTFSVEKEDIVVALDSMQQVVSIDAKVDESDPNSQNVLDKLTIHDETNEMLDKFVLKDAIMGLPEKERKIIILRYYRGKTQGEVAAILDVSQVQISRIESKIIEQLRNKLI